MTTTFKTITLALATLLTTAAIATAADWNLPVTVTSGTTKTGVVLGISNNATNGFDAGLDSPTPFTEETLNAYFSHPEWNITTANTPVTTFHRDIRGSIPQTFSLRVKTTLSPITMAWDSTLIPATVQAHLKTNGETINMGKVNTYEFAPQTQLSIIDIDITPGDTTAPAAPSNLQFSIKGTSIYLTWDANTEPDLHGYKLHLLDSTGSTTRSIDLKTATNYNLMNVINDVPYNLALSAYDTTGNESPRSTAITAMKVTPPQPPSVADGDVDGDGRLSIVDAIKVLRMALGLNTASATEMAHGDMDGDGKLTIRDALMLIRKVVGLN